MALDWTNYWCSNNCNCKMVKPRSTFVHRAGWAINFCRLGHELVKYFTITNKRLNHTFNKVSCKQGLIRHLCKTDSDTLTPSYLELGFTLDTFLITINVRNSQNGFHCLSNWFTIPNHGKNFIQSVNCLNFNSKISIFSYFQTAKIRYLIWLMQKTFFYMDFRSFKHR